MSKRKRHSEAVRREIWEEAGCCCWYCHQPIAYEEMELDHALALGLGGEDNPLNLVPACVPCHRGAGGKTADDRKRMAKADRCRTYMATGKGRKRRGRPLQSRGFDKRWSKKMRTGEVVKRDE